MRVTACWGLLVSGLGVQGVGASGFRGLGFRVFFRTYDQSGRIVGIDVDDGCIIHLGHVRTWTAGGLPQAISPHPKPEETLTQNPILKALNPERSLFYGLMVFEKCCSGEMRLQVSIGNFVAQGRSAS